MNMPPNAIIKNCREIRFEAPAIQVSALTKSIPTATHRVDILRGIDLEIERGEFVAIMGPSGSGKSTLLGLLAGLDTPTSGRIILDGEDITGLNEDRMALLRGRKIGFVFQSYHLLPTLTAEENVLLPYELTGGNGNGTTGPSAPANCSKASACWIAAIIIRFSFRAASNSA
jgi:putative ABC transport system ATP-binding protein